VHANNMVDPEQLVYVPADAAAQLGVSSSGLRRLAVIYERIHGELPRDSRLGRIWPTEAIDRLADARGAVQRGQAVSVEQALLTSLTSDPNDAQAEASNIISKPTTLDQFLEELRALRMAIEQQNHRLAALEEQNRALRLRLEASDQEPIPELRESAVSASEDTTKGDVPNDSAEGEIKQSWWRRWFGY
jgi:hypothetical protein